MRTHNFLQYMICYIFPSIYCSRDNERPSGDQRRGLFEFKLLIHRVTILNKDLSILLFYVFKGPTLFG